MYQQCSPFQCLYKDLVDMQRNDETKWRMPPGLFRTVVPLSAGPNYQSWNHGNLSSVWMSKQACRPCSLFLPSTPMTKKL